eukprot:gnl/TRDRNA2_/TRDRNA2_161990_c0_seq1.p1 gnl/TRDRNA2_/TRDRNA2_161990_c0~~gnl/TRDRNA2_/TRDRNA2_161990_c0_seq1.p1  ORF type:complete len:618 (-),score=115.26 gnl/TRDRNA2_/TRDRNA2_161990_c0_seq1:131-1984(-)
MPPASSSQAEPDRRSQATAATASATAAQFAAHAAESAAAATAVTAQATTAVAGVATAGASVAQKELGSLASATASAASATASQAQAIGLGATDGALSRRALDKMLKTQEEAVVGGVKKDDDKPRVPWTQGNAFNMAVGAVVMLNAVILGVEADFGEAYPAVFEVFEHFFTAAFTLELILHWLFEGFRMYFKDAMNWLDFTLVMMSVVDVWLLKIIGVDMGNLKQAAVLRMLRLTRLVRLVRLFHIFKELTLLISGLLGSMKTLSWALMFLSVTVYIFAIFARQIIGTANNCEDHEADVCDATSSPFYEFNPEIGDQFTQFGSIDRTMLTLFVCLTEGCGIDILHPIVRATPWLVFFWVFFIGFTTFGVLNLICGIICEQSLRTVARQEDALIANRDKQWTQKLIQMVDAFESMDTDKSGTVSRQEYLHAIRTNKQVVQAFIELGLHEEENLFDKLDADRTNDITFDQFFDGLFLIMKGHETAKAKDLVRTHMLCQSVTRKSKTVATEMEEAKKRQSANVKDAQALREASQALSQRMKDLNLGLDRLQANLKVIRCAVTGAPMSAYPQIPAVSQVAAPAVAPASASIGAGRSATSSDSRPPALQPGPGRPPAQQSTLR